MPSQPSSAPFGTSHYLVAAEGANAGRSRVGVQPLGHGAGHLRLRRQHLPLEYRLASAHLAQDVGLRGVPAGHRHDAPFPCGLAQVRAAAVVRAVARDRVPACRDHDREGAIGADGNVTVTAGADQSHGPRPWPRRRRRRGRSGAAHAVQVTGHGAIGGTGTRRSRARRSEPGQAHGSQPKADQGESHVPSTKRRCCGFPAFAAGYAPARRRSRTAAILLGRPHSSTKPLDRDWSNVSPVS
jgi:hypothetical protein